MNLCAWSVDRVQTHFAAMEQTDGIARVQQALMTQIEQKGLQGVRLDALPTRYFRDNVELLDACVRAVWRAKGRIGPSRTQKLLEAGLDPDRMVDVDVSDLEHASMRGLGGRRRDETWWHVTHASRPIVMRLLLACPEVHMDDVAKNYHDRLLYRASGRLRVLNGNPKQIVVGGLPIAELTAPRASCFRAEITLRDCLELDGHGGRSARKVIDRWQKRTQFVKSASKR